MRGGRGCVTITYLILFTHPFPRSRGELVTICLYINHMRKNKVDIITLGCSKNLVDSEQLMRQFVANGYTVEHDPHKINGEIVVVNTCGFIGDAQEESINMILELGEAKKKGKIGQLYVMGCLTERFRYR